MNKKLGATLMVAGTTIGGGMLAMPLTSAGIGFGCTLLLLAVLWLLLTFSALLFVELYQYVESDTGLGSLAEIFFGKTGRVVSSGVLLIFLYALVSAYVAGGSGILVTLLPESWQNDWLNKGAGLLFTFLFGSFIFIGTHSVDKLNRVIFFTKLAFFALVLMLLMPDVKIANLMATPIDNALLISAAPIFFTAFGFHGSIPSLNKYLDGNLKDLRFAIILGTFIPLFGYILWQFATHGVLSQSDFLTLLRLDPTLNGLVTATVHSTGSESLGLMVQLFSALALISSFLGVSLGLFETLEDVLKGFHHQPTRFTLGLITFLPPLIFALFYPEGFILALGYAGQMFAFYAIVLPVAMVWKQRKTQGSQGYQVMGGKISLVFTLLVGVFIVLVPFFVKAGYLPEVIG